MKRIYILCSALILSFLLTFTGCFLSDNGSVKVLNYLKEKEFYGDPPPSQTYKVNLTVNEDLSYSLSVSYGTGALKDYTAAGPKTEYYGCYEDRYTSEWLDVTQNKVGYYHAVVLPEATAEINGNTGVFYIVAYSSSKNPESYAISLVWYAGADDENYDKSYHVSRIKDSGPSFRLRVKG